MITVKGDTSFVDARRLTRSWPRRTRALLKIVAYEAAKKTKGLLLESIPSDRAWRVYRHSLQVVEVSTEKDEPAFAVRVHSVGKGGKKAKKDETLVYVRANRRMKKVNPAVEVLERYNPWTVDTLPMTPKGTDARMITRKVEKRVAEKVRKRRVADRLRWKAELGRVGVKVPAYKSKKSLPKEVTDVALSAYNLEFGIGMAGKPHWRPSLKELKNSSIKRLKRNPKILLVFNSPAFTGWKRWEKIRTSAKIRQGEARKFVPFQRKLGI